MIDTKKCQICPHGEVKRIFGTNKWTMWCYKYHSSVDDTCLTCNYKDVDAKFKLDFGSQQIFYAKTLEDAKEMIKKMGFDWNRAISTIPSEEEWWDGKRSWWIDETPRPGLIAPHIVEIQEL